MDTLTQQLITQLIGQNIDEVVIQVYEEKIAPIIESFLKTDLKGLDHEKTKDLIQAQHDFAKILILLLKDEVP